MYAGAGADMTVNKHVTDTCTMAAVQTATDQAAVTD